MCDVVPVGIRFVPFPVWKYTHVMFTLPFGSSIQSPSTRTPAPSAHRQRRWPRPSSNVPTVAHVYPRSTQSSPFLPSLPLTAPSSSRNTYPSLSGSTSTTSMRSSPSPEDSPQRIRMKLPQTLQRLTQKNPKTAIARATSPSTGPVGYLSNYGPSFKQLHPCAFRIHLNLPTVVLPKTSRTP